MHPVVHPKRVSPCRVHLDRHRDQRPSQWAQRTGRWHNGMAGLATATAATADAPAVGWCRAVHPLVDVPRRPRGSVIGLRMAGVGAVVALRMLMVLGAWPLRMVGVLGLLALRMLGEQRRRPRPAASVAALVPAGC